MASRAVVAVCPIRQRLWVLDEHLAALEAQSPAGIFYLEGDSTDGTAERLDEYAGAGRLVVEHANSGSPFWHRSIGPRYTGDQHQHLAIMYNAMVDAALQRFPAAEFLWLVDSDVLPEPFCLARLLEAKVDVIAPVVQHSPNAFNFMMGWNRDGEPARSGEEAKRVMELPPGKREFEGWLGPYLPFPATFVSCCVLYRREVLERRVEPLPSRVNEDGIGVHESGFTVHQHRFAPHPRSHDFPMVASLQRAGVKLWVHPQARAEHRMEEPAR